jgi:Heterokaryon incompatibility protein (HET)
MQCVSTRIIRRRGRGKWVLWKKIYKHASQVLIWLGKESEADQVGFAMLEAFKRSIDINNGYQYNFDQKVIDGIMPPVASSAWTGLVKLFQRDWFFRAWVI